MPTYKDLGILHAMVGTIPDSYRWGLKLLGGLDGTIDQGRREMEQVVGYAQNHDFIFREETTAFYAYLLLHLDNRGESAWDIMKHSGFKPEENLLHCFVVANVAMRTNRNEDALQALEHRPRGNEYLDFHYLDLMLGLARLRQLDPAAEEPLLRYARGFRGQNFVKEAYQKLAWNALIHGDTPGYYRYLEACKQNGNATVEGDKAAQREAEIALEWRGSGDGQYADELPNPSLLRARLLFDGGYYEKARLELAQKEESDFPEGQQRLEFLYRQGRILHGLKQYAGAINYYHRSIDQGKDSPKFYACNAALQTGLIYEEMNMTEMATRFFEVCLDTYPDEYRNGLHQRAKAGLARLKTISPQ